MSLNQHLYYIHDPMCSWCWAFRPTLHRLLSKLPSKITTSYLLGGLAPESDKPLEVDLQNKIMETWKLIQSQLPDTEFNYEFWTKNIPRRSTYPACRSVIAARQIDHTKEEDMIYAIQQAYYIKAMNPSDYHILEGLAINIGINGTFFSNVIHSNATTKQLMSEIEQSRSMGIYSFPSLVFKVDNRYKKIPIEYQDENTILETLLKISS
ncbi:MAG: DsbA family protein [Candidatus Thiodiazotropha lotti]